MIALTLDHDLERYLESLGASSVASKLELARQALREALEDRIDLRLAQERLAKPERSWSLEELERGDDLEG